MVFGATLTPLDFSGVPTLNPDSGGVPTPAAWWEPDTNVTRTYPVRTLASASSQYFSLADSAAISLGSDTNFGGSAWVYFTDKAANATVIAHSQTASSKRSWRVFYHQPTDLFRFAVSSDGTGGNETTLAAATFGSPPTATWIHLAWWYDGANLYIRINDTSEDSTPHTGTFDTNEALMVGAQGITSAPDNFWNGRLAFVGFWKGGYPDSTAVTELYNAGNGKAYANLSAATKTDLLLWYDANERGTGNLLDSVGSNDATANAAPSFSDQTDFNVNGTGAVLSTWSDATSTYDLTQSTYTKRPVYQSSLLGAGNGYLFDGVDDLLTVANSVVSASNWTLMAVAKITEYNGTVSIADASWISSSDEATDNFNIRFGPYVHDDIEMYGVAHRSAISGTENVVADSNTPLIAGVEFIVTITHKDGVTTMRVRGRDGSVTTITGSTADSGGFNDVAGRDNFTLGALKNNSGESEHAAVTLGDVVIWDEDTTELTPTQRQGLEKGFSNKYTLSLGYATSGFPKMFRQGQVFTNPAWLQGAPYLSNFYGPRVLNNDDHRGDVPGLPAARFSMIYTSDHTGGVNDALGIATFEYPFGTFTDNGSPIDTDCGENHHMVVDASNNRVNLYPHRVGGAAGGQTRRLYTTTDLSTISVEVGEVEAYNGQHEGYGDDKLVDGTFYCHRYFSGQSPRTYAISADADDGDSFTIQRLFTHLRGYIGATEDAQLTFQETVQFRNQWWAYAVTRDFITEDFTNNVFGVVKWQWSAESRHTSGLYPFSYQNAEFDPEWHHEFMTWFSFTQGGNETIYAIVQAKDSSWATEGDAGSHGYLLGPNMFESIPDSDILTSRVTLSDGLPVYTVTPATETVASWDATAEAVTSNSDFTVTVVAGTDETTFSSGNYTQFQHASGAAQDLYLQYTSTLDLSDRYAYDIEITGITLKSGVALADSAYEFRFYDASGNNGIRLTWDNDDLRGEFGERNASTGQSKNGIFTWGEYNQNRGWEHDLVFRVFDNGTKFVLLIDGVECFYQELDYATWSASKPSIRIFTPVGSSNPQSWLRLKAFNIKRSAT